jgi:hypothetical protein
MTGLPPVRCPECGGNNFCDRNAIPINALAAVNLCVTALAIAGQFAMSRYVVQYHCGESTYASVEIFTQSDATILFRSMLGTVLAGPVVAGLLSLFHPSKRTLALSMVASVLGQVGLFALVMRLNANHVEQTLCPVTIAILVAGVFFVSGLWYAESCVPMLRERWTRLRPSSAPPASSSAPSSRLTAQPGPR